MSRAGKHPIEIKQGVTVKLEGTDLYVTGPKGEVKLDLNIKNIHLINIDIKDTEIVITPKDKDNILSKTMWGTIARNIKIAIQGVTEEFKKELYMNGVGYKASVKGNQLILNAGYSHDIVFDIPEGLRVEIADKPTEFTIFGVDKGLLGQFADKIHKVRKVDPYKGKGIFYKGEKIIRKEGKKK